MNGEKKLINKNDPMKKTPVVFSLGAFFILSIFLSLLITQRNLFQPKKRFYTYVKNASGLDVRPRVYLKGIDVGRVTSYELTKDNKIKIDFYILKKYLKNISKNTIVMTEENLLTGGIDKLNLATEFATKKRSVVKNKFIPWEYTPEGKRIKDEYELDFAGNQISIIVSQLSTMFTNMDKKELSKSFRNIVLNTEIILGDINKNKIPNELGDTVIKTKNLIISLRKLVDNYKDPNGILLKMTDPNLRKIFSKIELSLTHLAGILEKVHDNKHEIGPLLENINVVLKDVKGITGKLNRMELFEKREKKQEPIKFEIDN